MHRDARVQGMSGRTREGAWAGCDRVCSGWAHVRGVKVQGGCEHTQAMNACLRRERVCKA